ncbi:Bax inhibitor-1/YccA family protein [Luteococcus sediminum]
MANPILSQRDAFTARAPQSGYQQGYAQPGFPAPGQPQYGQTPYGQPQYGQASGTGLAEPSMTLDDVIGKTGITMLTLMASAVASFLFLPAGLLMPALVLSALVGMVTVFMVAGRKKLNPGMVLFYAVVEGVFVGAFSQYFEAASAGIVKDAVLGTFAAAGATLAAYKYFNVRVGSRFRRMVFIATAAFAGVMLVNFVLALLGFTMGVRTGALGLVVALLGAGLAVFNLVIDFDDIERGIAMNAPASESWRAAFGLTVTMVWLYIEILRILDYFRR